MEILNYSEGLNGKNKQNESLNDYIFYEKLI